MEVICTEKHNIILFFIYPDNKFLALLLLNSLEKKKKNWSCHCRKRVGCFVWSYVYFAWNFIVFGFKYKWHQLASQEKNKKWHQLAWAGLWSQLASF